jgi:hypothetical protein
MSPKSKYMLPCQLKQNCNSDLIMMSNIGEHLQAYELDYSFYLLEWNKVDFLRWQSLRKEKKL